ncbi:MAG: AEC family transporter [Betaproteobacteria bacterium]
MTIVYRILTIILPVFGVVIIGYIYGRIAKPNMAGANKANMDVILPVLIFVALSSKEFDLAANAWLVVASIGIVLLSGLAAFPYARLMHGDPKTFVPPMMFNNCGNMGVPIAIIAAGQQGLGMMTMLFTTSNLLQFTLGTWIIRRKVGWHDVLVNPMVIATILGVTAGLLHPTLPQWVDLTLKMLGDVAFPLMLFALGVRMCDITFEHWHVGLVGAIVCPLTGLLAGAILVWLLPLTPPQQAMVWIFASLPPAVLNFLIADRYQQEPAKVAAIVLIGNLGSVIFVPLGLALALQQL